MQSKSGKAIGFLAIVFLTFGITYLNFDDLSFSENIRPYIMLLVGIITLVYWLIIPSKPK
jgi:hypothetical protein